MLRFTDISLHRGGRALFADLTFTLHAGWNRLMFKVANRYGYWGLKLRLGTAEGAALTGLEYSTNQPLATTRPAE